MSDGLIRGHTAEDPAVKDFDYLAETQIYLDSACQTLRPQQTINAMDRYYHEYNACGERVKHEWGRKVDEEIQDTRERLLKLIGKSRREYVCAFTLNTTYGINLLLSQLAENTFERIITSAMEHNSVFLPSITYARKLGLGRSVLSRQPDGALDYQPQQLSKSIVLVNTTSNIDGSILTNATALASDTHRAGGIVILDAAQTMGHHPELITHVDFDAACFSGHKMYGPSIGVIIAKKTLLERLDPSFIGGGTVQDVQRDAYTLLPDEPASRLEPGLQNFAGIIGLGAAIGWLAKYRPEGKMPKDYVQALAQKLYDGISRIPHVTLFNHAPSSIVSFYSDKINAHKLSIYLSAQGIMARSGYFCCHYYLDALSHLPPLLRLSLGLNNTQRQVESTVRILERIITEQ